MADVQRGCLAVAPPQPAYNHNKFFLFSGIGPFDDRPFTNSTVYNAYFSTPTGSAYRGFSFPRGDASYNNPATDTVVDVLNEVICAYSDSVITSRLDAGQRAACGC